MKIKVAHATAGFVVGLICYALYLYCFIFFGPKHQTYLSMMPLPSGFGPVLEYRKSVLSLLWQFNWLELIVILLGLVFPIACAGFGWRRAGKRPVAWLNRWYFQLAFAVIGVIVMLVILNSMMFILPIPLL